VGGNDSWGSLPLKNYLLPAEDFSYRFHLQPIKAKAKKLPELGRTLTSAERAYKTNLPAVGDLKSLKQKKARSTTALGWSVTADSEERNSGNLVGNAFDGDPETRWCAADSRTGHWIKIDFGEEKAVGSLKTTWENSANYKYHVAVSNDGKAWKTTADFSDGSDELKTKSALVNATTRFVRITVDALPEGRWASICEVELED
jgi:hypothetical protein